LSRKDRNVPENVSIAYRGAHYAIGQGPQFYGIWHAAAPQSQPVEWWPLTPDGWSGAWARFASIEAPGTISPVTQQILTQPAAATSPATDGPATDGPATDGPATDGPATAGPATAGAAPGSATLTRSARIPAGLLGLGVLLGIAGLFPAYVAGASLASQPADVVAHSIYLAAWGVSGVLIVLCGMRLRAGALLGLGVSAVTLGLFFADAATSIPGGASRAGAGLVLSILGWVACTAGAGLAVRTTRSVRTAAARDGAVPERGRPNLLRRVSSHEIAPTVTLVLAAVGAAIAFAPSWDSFTLQTPSGFSRTITEGNAFANAGWVITGDVLVMVALVAVVMVAALRRPTRLGAALAIGAIIPMVAQAISAIVQINGAGATSPLQFGVSQSQANQAGLTIGAGLTPMFWLFCAFLATLILLCGWLLLAHEAAAPDHAAPSAASPYAAAPYPAPAAGGPQAGPPYPSVVSLSAPAPSASEQ
jgi:hypothetical protein